jgi:hypothetical protein
MLRWASRSNTTSSGHVKDKVNDEHSAHPITKAHRTGYLQVLYKKETQIDYQPQLNGVRSMGMEEGNTSVFQSMSALAVESSAREIPSGDRVDRISPLHDNDPLS